MAHEQQELSKIRDDDLARLMRNRRSVRRLSSEPVPDRLILQILEAGRWAPSPHGTQPWRFVVITRMETKLRLVEAMASSWEHNLAMDGEAPEIITKRLAGSRRRMLEAPVLILLCLFIEELDHYPDPERQQAEFTMAIQSLGACSQNMLLTAFQLGLDAGWMCAPLFCPDIARDALELPANHVPHALFPIGYAAADPRRRARKSLDELITRWV